MSEATKKKLLENPLVMECLKAVPEHEQKDAVETIEKLLDNLMPCLAKLDAMLEAERAKKAA